MLEGLAAVRTRKLVVSGTSDIFFDVKRAEWLSKTIPSTREVMFLEGAKLPSRGMARRSCECAFAIPAESQLNQAAFDTMKQVIKHLGYRARSLAKRSANARVEIIFAVDGIVLVESSS